jgi:predicted membrane-bound spermidine synthase
MNREAKAVTRIKREVNATKPLIYAAGSAFQKKKIFLCMKEIRRRAGYYKWQ